MYSFHPYTKQIKYQKVKKAEKSRGRQPGYHKNTGKNKNLQIKPKQ